VIRNKDIRQFNLLPPICEGGAFRQKTMAFSLSRSIDAKIEILGKCSSESLKGNLAQVLTTCDFEREKSMSLMSMFMMDDGEKSQGA
jgi:hypothetical protein